MGSWDVCHLFRSTALDSTDGACAVMSRDMRVIFGSARNSRTRFADWNAAPPVMLSTQSEGLIAQSGGERTPQRDGREFLGFVRLVQETGHAEEAVKLARVFDERCRHSGVGKLLRVLDPFIA